MVSLITSEQRQRVRAVAILTALGSPSYALCYLSHVCMAGHMQHAPYPAGAWINDLVWTACFVAVIVLSLSLRTKGRIVFFSGSVVLICSRILLGSLGGTGLLIELPLLIVMNTYAIYYLVRANTLPMHENTSPVQLVQGSKTRLSFCLIGLLLLTALAIWQYFH